MWLVETMLESIQIKICLVFYKVLSDTSRLEAKKKQKTESVMRFSLVLEPGIYQVGKIDMLNLLATCFSKQFFFNFRKSKQIKE